MNNETGPVVAANTSTPDGGTATSCVIDPRPVVLQCPNAAAGHDSAFRDILGMGWPLAILLSVGLILLFDRTGRIGKLLGALTSFVDRTTRVSVGGAEFTAEIEKALQHAPATGVAPVGDLSNGDADTDDALIQKLLAKDFSGVTVGDYPYLMHEGKKTPKGRFPYAANVYLEFWDKNSDRPQKGDIEKVFYRVDDTFPKKWWVMTSDNRSKDFQLAVNIVGEFTIVAVVKFKSGKSVWLTRYLDLPGRPTD